MRPIRIQKAEKNKKQGNRGWIYLLAFLFPVLIFTLGFALKGVYPFGENSALVVDGVHQYTAFYRELSEQLGKGTGWTWSAHAMGYNFFRAKEKSCHILGDTENSADVTASF